MTLIGLKQAVDSALGFALFIVLITELILLSYYINCINFELRKSGWLKHL